MQIYRHFYAETQDADNSSDELSAEFIDAEVYANTIEPYNYGGPRNFGPPRRSLSQIIREAYNLARHRLRFRCKLALPDAREHGVRHNLAAHVNPSSYMRPRRRGAPSPATVARKERAARKAMQAAEGHHRRCCDLWRDRLPNSDAATIDVIARYFEDGVRTWTLHGTYLPWEHPAEIRDAIGRANSEHDFDGGERGFVFESRETMNDGDRSWFEFRGEGSPR